MRAWFRFRQPWGGQAATKRLEHTPNLPTKSIPTKIRWRRISWKFPLVMRTPPLEVKIMLESNSLKSRILVRRLAVVGQHVHYMDTYCLRRTVCGTCCARREPCAWYWLGVGCACVRGGPYYKLIMRGPLNNRAPLTIPMHPAPFLATYIYIYIYICVCTIWSCLALFSNHSFIIMNNNWPHRECITIMTCCCWYVFPHRGWIPT